MELLADKIVTYIVTEDSEWRELELMKMKLGVQVLFHNIFMTGLILMFAKILGIFKNSVILFATFGILKMTAGGVHFQKSYQCLFATGLFIFSGVWLSGKMCLSIGTVIAVYLISLMIFWLVAPQGTQNNPISEKNYQKLKYRTMMVGVSYFIYTIYRFALGKEISYLLLIAVAFEAVSLLPEKFRKKY